MKKKKVIIALSVVGIVLILIIILVAGSNHNNRNEPISNYSYETEAVQEESQENSLADSCQYVLATGYDSDGTCYQLVGEDYESYDKSIIRFGVIKNNQWLVEMSEDVPFIDEKHCLYSGMNVDGERNSEAYSTLKAAFEKSSESNISDRFGYIGNGCFYLRSNISSKTRTIVEQLRTVVFWNPETNCEKIINNVIMSDMENYISGNDAIISVLSDHLFRLSNDQFADMDIQLLNPQTLETKTIFTQHFDINSSWSSYEVHQSSENLFYVEKDNSFYNTDGNKVFELGFNNAQEIGQFKDGQCELITQVGSGGQYRVIIDKTGNVISNEKIN